MQKNEFNKDRMENIDANEEIVNINLEGSINISQVNEIEELLPMVEELDNFPESPIETIGENAGLETSQDSPFVNNNCSLNKAITLLHSPNINSLFLDKNFIILHISAAIHSLFKGYYTIQNKPFFNVFGQAFSPSDVNIFLKKIRDPACGFSWSGTLTHKKREKKTLYTKTSVFPLFENNTLMGYWAIFEDITDSHWSQYETMLKSLLNASKLKDNDTGFHNERLNYYSKVLTEELFAKNLFPQIDADFIYNISTLAAIHDIGKIGTPDYILQKKGKLTPEEWKVMKEHTINGTLIVSSYPVPMAKEITLSHHERWDGTGYPYGFSGEMIPLSARIVAVVDVYDALRMKRSYKESYSHEDTMEHILQGSGSHFDPRIIPVFKKVAGELNEIFEANKNKDDF